ncbi:enoyl-CoA hydratase/isomerase family protein [Rhodobacteraceae bacterium CCMM004]|nr:enoyl-CoA hydratase/isomerase family protein [Rhodobacteraceae bacterium CCMM004]
MSDIDIRIAGRAGRITLTRPHAMNALTPEMGRAIAAALAAWRDDDAVAMVVIDAEGDRAFCAGGDIAMIYEAGRAGDYSLARDFWREEYRLNADLFHFPKPVATFLQGYTMGGGVGIGCHGSHRVTCDGSKIAMPECGIGLIPDVGGSLLLARAPGRLGEYLGTTGARMGPADAIHAGFADYYTDRADWPELIAALERSGDWTRIDAAATDPGPSPLATRADVIDRTFSAARLPDIVAALASEDGAFAEETRAALARVSPLSATATVELVRRVRGLDTIEAALEMEFRGTYRAIEEGDFLEGIRAAVIDKDGRPNWRHASISEVPAIDAARLLMPLGGAALTL